MNLDQFRNFTNASETITVPNPVYFTGAVYIAGTAVASTSTFVGDAIPNVSDTGALGSTTNMWEDLFLASGGVINFNNGDVTVTHSANSLAFAGGTSYTFDAAILPSVSDGAALGSATVMWSDLFLAAGGVVNFDNGDVTITHAANLLTIAGGGVTFSGAVTCNSTAQFSGAVTVGVDATGYDVTFFGDTTGCSLLYDQSEDQLVLTGPADVPALKIVGGGSYEMTTHSANGSAWADGGTPAFIADQKYFLIDLNGTVYRIPLWANA